MFDNQYKSILTSTPDWSESSQVDDELIGVITHSRKVAFDNADGDPFEVELSVADHIDIEDRRVVCKRQEPLLQFHGLGIVNRDTAPELAATITRLIELADGEPDRERARAQGLLDVLRAQDTADRTVAYFAAVTSRLVAIPGGQDCGLDFCEHTGNRDHEWRASGPDDEITRSHSRTFHLNGKPVGTVDVFETLHDDGSITADPPSLLLDETVEVTDPEQARRLVAVLADAAALLATMTVPLPVGPDEARAAAVAELRGMAPFDEFLTASATVPSIRSEVTA